MNHRQAYERARRILFTLYAKTTHPPTLRRAEALLHRAECRAFATR